MENASSSKRGIVKAVRWSVMAEFARRCVTPIVFLVLARILSPSDFGLAAISMLIISFSQAILEGGMGRALIQSGCDVQKTGNVVFWTNVVSSIFFYILLFVFADQISYLLDEKNLSLLLRVQGLQIPIAALGSVQTAVLQKNLEFKKMFLIQIITSLLPCLASLPLAFYGYGYWALVGGSMIGAISQTVIVWNISSWRPQISYYSPKSVLHFGGWSAAESVLGWCFAWGDIMIISAFLSTEEVGVYRAGSQLVSLPFSILLSPILPVLYAGFSGMVNNKTYSNNFLNQSSNVLALLSFPIAGGLFLLRNEVGHFVFGEEWSGVGDVIGVFCIVNFLYWPISAISEAIRANGKPDINAKILFVLVFFQYSILLLCFKFGGLYYFLALRSVLPFFSLLFWLFMGKHALGLNISLFFYGLRYPFFSMLIMMAFVYLGAFFVGHFSLFLQMFSLVFLGGVSYVLSYALLDMQGLRRIFVSLMRMR